MNTQDIKAFEQEGAGSDCWWLAAKVKRQFLGAKIKTPTQRWHKYPPAKDNPGRVSEGCAKDLAKKAELASKRVSHEDAILYLRAVRTDDKNKRKAERRARRNK